MAKKSEVKKEAGLIINAEDPAEQFVEHWIEHEGQSIYAVDDVPGELGVTAGFYSGLPTLERILAVRSGTKKSYLFPLNKMLEIMGAPDAGKTSLLLHLGAGAIAAGGVAIFVDWEHKYDPTWFYRIAAMNFGISEEQAKKYLLYIDPKHVEWFLGWLIKMLKSITASRALADKTLKELETKKKKPADYEEQQARCKRILAMPFVILNDSIASMYTEAEVNREEETPVRIAELARRFAESLKLVRKVLPGSNTTIIATNQERSLINQGPFMRPGAMTTPGGNAWKYYCDARIRVVKTGTLYRTRAGIKFAYGSEHKLMTKKNQLGVPPFAETELHMLFDRGYDSFYSLVEACVAEGLVKKEGSRYIIGQGEKAFSLEESSLDEDVKNLPPKMKTILQHAYQKKIGVAA